MAGVRSLRRVLMTADAVGGVWHYALDLIRALAVHEMDVALCVMGPAPTSGQRRDAERIPNLTLWMADYRLEWMPEPWSDVERAGAWLLEVADKTAVDVVHLNGYAHGRLPWGRPSIIVAHSCVRTWWWAVHRCAPGPEWTRYTGHVARGLRSASAVVAPSRSMLRDLHRQYGEMTNSRVITNSRSASTAARVPKQPFVLGAGRLWDEAKNTAALAAVGPSLSWPIYLAGPRTTETTETTGTTGTTEKTASEAHYLGALRPETLGQWMARAAIFAHPARYEPFGLSVLEAGQAGCALILGAIPSLQELWSGAALFVEPDDRAALADALNRVIADDGLRARLGDAARRRAAQYRIEGAAARYADLYRRLHRDWWMSGESPGREEERACAL